VNMDSPTANDDDGTGGGGGAWESVGPGKKGSKGKKGNKGKMKNARTLSLQTFVSEYGASEEGSEMLDDVDLTPEEILARESLLTYFSDLIRRNGPMKVSGSQIRSHLEDRMSDGDSLLSGKAVVEIEQMPGFLSSSPDLVIVDDIVCDKRHKDQARKAALDQVLENFAALSNPSTSSADPANLNNRTTNPYLRTTTSPALGGISSVPTPPPSAGNVWNKGPPGTSTGGSGSTAASNGTGLPQDLLQFSTQPNRVESLFNGQSVFGPITSQSPARASPSSAATTSAPATTHLPDLSSPPPPLPTINNSTLSAASAMAHTDINQTLTESNTELLANLVEQKKKNSVLESRERQLDSRVLQLERQLSEAKEEIAKLKGSLAVSQAQAAAAAANNGSSIDSSDESNTLFSLKKELESERLKTVTLKTQLETEKNMGRQVQEKHRLLLGKLGGLMGEVGGGGRGNSLSTTSAVTSSTTSSIPHTAPISGFGTSSPFGDTFGFGSSFGMSSTSSGGGAVGSAVAPPPSSVTPPSSVSASAAAVLAEYGISTPESRTASHSATQKLFSSPSPSTQAPVGTTRHQSAALGSSLGLDSAASSQQHFLAATAALSQQAINRQQQQLPPGSGTSTADLLKQFGRL